MVYEIRTRNPIMRAAAHSHLRPWGRRDRPFALYWRVKKDVLQLNWLLSFICTGEASVTTVITNIRRCSSQEHTDVTRIAVGRRRNVQKMGNIYGELPICCWMK